MKLNRLKYVTVIFRQYVTFDSINFKCLNFTTQGVLNQFCFKILYPFRCLFISNARINCVKCVNIINNDKKIPQLETKTGFNLYYFKTNIKFHQMQTYLTLLPLIMYYYNEMSSRKLCLVKC